MELIHNSNLIEDITTRLAALEADRTNELILQPFVKDFTLRFCWSSNAIEGNTLTLEETVSVIEHDQVHSGHSLSEHEEAKYLHHAVEQMMLPLRQQPMTEAWMKEANGLLPVGDGEYRQKEVYIGSLVEAVHYPPACELVPDLMKEHVRLWNERHDACGRFKLDAEAVAGFFDTLAKEHFDFESIHPFLDGNGRVGRMVMNQRLINYGLLPIAIEPSGAYRQSFRRFEKHQDASQLVHILCSAELDAICRMEDLKERFERRG